MQAYHLSLLALVCASCGISFAIQFEDEAASANLEQAQIVGVVSESRGGFFPSNDEPDDSSSSRYPEISGIKYVDDYETFNSNANRKQLSFSGNSPVRSPPTQMFLSENQFYQQQQQQLHSPAAYRPSASAAAVNPVHASAIRKPPKFPYPFANYYSHPSSSADLSSPFYQNYANYYQYPSSSSPVPVSVSPYYDYYANPTRYTSKPSANLYGHPLHQQSQYPNYYTNNYANQYGYQRPSSLYANQANAPGVSNFINNVRDSTSGGGPLGQLSTVGSQFSKALEDISINDDLQCVPKLLCTMIRNPSRPNQLPSFLNIPGLTAIISALPSSSPLMNFGRAALLGLSGGHCDSAYPKCPRDDTQLLYYLNNHRGGFFRFFNGGNSFGDLDEASVLSQQQLNQQPASQGLNMLALQALADTLSGAGGGGSGFNLNNLLGSQSSQRPIAAPQQSYQGLQADQSAGLLGMLKPGVLSDVVSNLLTGVIGNRFSRQLSKRSVDTHKIEKRIVHLPDEKPVSFFDESSGENKDRPNTLFDDLNERPLKFSSDIRLSEQPLRFSNDNRISEQQSYALKFPHEPSPQSGDLNQGSFVTSADIAKRIKMLFPDVDHFSEQFHQNLLRLMLNDQRFGKILTGGQRPISNNGDSYYSINRYPSVSQSQSHNAGSGGSSSNYNNYGSNNRQPQYTSSHNNNNSDRSHIVYVTNARGQVEYALNELTGEKTRYQ